jgi:hypothetical protein
MVVADSWYEPPPSCCESDSCHLASLAVLRSLFYCRPRDGTFVVTTQHVGVDRRSVECGSLSRNVGDEVDFLTPLEYWNLEVRILYKCFDQAVSLRREVLCDGWEERMVRERRSLT